VTLGEFFVRGVCPIDTKIGAIGEFSFVFLATGYSG